MEKQYDIGISPDGMFYHVRAFRVPYTANLALEVAREIINLGDKIGILGCIIDIRGTTSISSVLEKYQFANEKASLVGLPHHWKYAFLKDQTDESPNFIETVMQNVGFSLKIFKDEREAIDWLKGS